MIAKTQKHDRDADDLETSRSVGLCVATRGQQKQVDTT